MSLIMACSSVAPMVAPLIGSQVLAFFGWRAIFWVLAGIGVVGLVFSVLRLPETLKPEDRLPIQVKRLVSAYRIALTDRTAVGYTLAMTGMVNTISDSLFDNVPYDINKDFVHIASLGEGPQ